MKLQTLTLKNFKGLTDLTLPMDGQNIGIWGDNGTGKTTVADAFYYLLFGKDSLNRKDFEVLPLDENGQRRMDVTQAEVEGVFDIDGKPVTLKRIYSEKWTKKRGSAQKECTGHETIYYIDGVPMKQKDYDAVIAKLTDSEEAFKLLTNPRYFCEVLSWQRRRELLLQVCGDLTDEDVIASDKKLAELPKILAGLTMDDRRKVIKSRLTEINKELERIPVRIDEVQKGLPEIPPDTMAFADRLPALRKTREGKLEKKTRIEAGGQIAELTKRVRELDAELLMIDNEAKKGTNTEAQKHQQAIADLQMHITTLKNQIKGNQDLAKRNDSLADNLDSILVDLREEWAKLNKQDYTGADTCPTCGQALPADQVDAARAKFNADKSKRLEKIQADGKIQRKKLDDLKAENERLAAKNAEIEQSIAANQESIKEVQGDIAVIEAPPPASPESDAIIAEIKKLALDIAQLKTDSAEAAKSVQAEINSIDNQISEVEHIIAQAKQREEGLKRIDDLKAQQKKLAKEYEGLEKQLVLTDLFVQTKVGLLTDKINSRFQIARFKLFDVQVNGGIAECCECTVNGIPYGGGLNNGARINAGLDIINTLSEHFSFAPVVFVDNAEAVTDLLPTVGQQVRLYVSEADKKLRVVQAKEAVHA